MQSLSYNKGFNKDQHRFVSDIKLDSPVILARCEVVRFENPIVNERVIRSWKLGVIVVFIVHNKVFALKIDFRVVYE